MSFSSNSFKLENLFSYETADSVCNIGDFDKEIEKIIKVFQKRLYRNVLIYGSSGTGKKSLVEKTIYTFSQDSFLKSYGEYQFLKLNTAQLASLSKREILSFFDELNARMKSRKNSVLVIYEIEYLLSRDIICRQLKELMQKGFCVISTLSSDIIPSSEEYNGIYDLFEKIHIYPPLTSEIYDRIHLQIASLEVYHNIKISENTAKYLIYASKAFNRKSCEPRKSLDIIDSIMAISKMAGNTEVKNEDIFLYYSSEFSTFKNLSETEKTRTAVHEIGHMLIYMLSPELKDYSPVAINLIPSGENLGLTYVDYPPEKITTYNEDYFVQIIAVFLGGKIAEELFSFEANTGPSEDLTRANEIANEAASLFSLDIKLEDRVLLSENVLSSSDGETLMLMLEYSNDLIRRAREYAIQLLDNNMDVAKKLLSNILDKGILVKREIEEIVFGN